MKEKKEKKAKLSFVQILQKLARAGVQGSVVPNRTTNSLDTLPELEHRIEQIFGIVNNTKRPAGNMLFFVMYDIESNKVRYQVVKYLLKKGCTRVQKSIFLADLDASTYETIKSDLTEVQACYENNDSILIVPVSTDHLKAMKVIGQKIEIDIITHSKNTLFF